MSRHSKSCDSIRPSCVPSGRRVLESLIIPETESNCNVCKNCSCCMVIEEYTIETEPCKCSDVVRECPKFAKIQTKKNSANSKDALQTRADDSSDESYASSTSYKTYNKKYSTPTDKRIHKSDTERSRSKTPSCCEAKLDTDEDTEQCFKGKLSVCASKEKHSAKDKRKNKEEPVNEVKITEPTAVEKACCKMITCPRSAKSSADEKTCCKMVTCPRSAKNNRDENKAIDSKEKDKTEAKRKDSESKSKSSPCNCIYPPEFSQFSCGGTTNIQCKCPEKKSKK